MNAIEKRRVCEIISLHNEIIGHFRKGIQKAIRIGELLVKQKASLRYGEFMKWIEDNLPFTDRTARRYIMLYENRERVRSDNLSDLKLSHCYRLLAEPSEYIGNIGISEDNGAFIDDLDEAPSQIVHARALRQRKMKKKSISGLDVNTIYCGDARDILQYMPDDSIDLIVSSPPYDFTRHYEGHTFDFEVFKEIALQLSRVMKKGGVLAWVVADGIIDNSESLSSMKQALHFREECGLNLHDTMIYLKNSPSFPAHRQSNRFSQSFEYIFVFSKGKPRTFNLLCDRRNKWANTTSFGTPSMRDVDGSLTGYYKPPTPVYSPRGNIWKYNTGRGYTSKDEMAFHHPAPFPDLLAYDCIRAFSNCGDIVLDPLAGSGTVGAMAKVLKRYFISIEISERYCHLTRERLKFPHNADELTMRSALEYNSVVWEDVPYTAIIADIQANGKRCYSK